MKTGVLNLILMIFVAINLSGCGNLSPRQRQIIDNTNGKIGEMENLTNSMKNEINGLKSQADIQNSKLEHVQQGLANYQSHNENSGVQILSGSGGVVCAIIIMVCLTMIILHYRGESIKNAKTADILAERIVENNDLNLEDSIFQACLHSSVEANVLNLMKKHQTKKAIRLRNQSTS